MIKRMKTGKEKLNFFFENGNRGYTYQGMLWAGFIFGTGRNHECDDIIDCFREELRYCLRKLNILFGKKIERCNLHRLVINKNSSSIALLLIFTEKEDDVHSLIITPNDMYLIKNASHKCYLHLLENGNPLVTFASNIKEGRGIFDGERIYFGEKITSSLPETLNLKIAGNEFVSKFFRGNGESLFIGDIIAEKASSIRKNGVTIINFLQKGV